MHASALSRRSLALAALAAVSARGTRPAAARRATAAAGDRLLVETAFAPDELPAGDVQAFFYRVTVPPGETLTHLVGPFCGCGDEALSPGVGVELVRSGAYAVRLDAPFQVLRAEGSADDIAADVVAVLAPGDAARFPAYAAAGAIRAEGAEPVVVVGLAVVAVADAGTPAPDIPAAVRGEALAAMTPLTWNNTVGGGPVEIRFRRRDVPAGGSIGPYAPDGIEAILVESGDLDVGTLRPGEDSSGYPPFSYGEGRAMPFLALGHGNTRLLENAGDMPASLLVVSVSGTATAMATPAA